MKDYFSRFHFNIKLLLLIVPPLVVIFYLTLNNAIRVYADYKSLCDVEQTMVATTKISALIHELQIERGMSTAYISSKGSSFKEELLSQQKFVDKISSIKDIDKIRDSVMKLEISVDKEMKYYSNLIAIYLEEISKIIKKTNDPWMIRELIVYDTFLLYKENTGIERAIGSTMFTNKKFDFKIYEKFVSMRSNKDAYLRLFKRYADKEVVDLYSKMAEDNSFTETKRMENLLHSGENAVLFQEKPEYWFAVITIKIDILKDIKDKLESIIFEHVKERQDKIYRDTFVLMIINIFMFAGIIAIMLYVSKKLYEEHKTKTKLLLQQSKMAAIGEMLGAISHQWRQPLNAVGVLAQEIEYKCEMNILDKEELKALNNQLLEYLEYMSNTINDFRDFYKPDKQKKVFNVVHAVHDSLNIISDQFKIHNIEIEIVIKSKIQGDEFSLYSINGFEGEFKQTIINLLQNAKDAIELNEQNIANKKILITIQRNEYNLEIRIKDNGGGIKKESLGRVFDIYFSTKETQQGTGLGLYMSKLIIERNMQGKIKATNKDDGAEFIISLIPESL